MIQSGVQVLPLSKLGSPDVPAVIVSKFDVARYEEMIRSAGHEDLPVIQVGSISGRTLLPLSHLALVQACRNAGITHLRAHIERLASRQEFLVRQVRHHSVDEPLNPLMIRSVIDELGRAGMDAGEAVRQVLLADTGLARLCSHPITAEALDTLSEFVERDLSPRLPASRLVVPYYALHKIGRLPESLQQEGVSDFINLTLIETEMNFCWPTPEQISYSFKRLAGRRVQKDSELAEVSESPTPQSSLRGTRVSGHDGKNGGDGKDDDAQDAAPQKPKKPGRDTQTLLDQVKDAIFIEDPQDGRPVYMVDTRQRTAHRISKSDDKKSFILSENVAKPVLTMPGDVARHHDLENRVLHNRNFASAGALNRLVGRLQDKPGVRYTLFWTVGQDDARARP